MMFPRITGEYPQDGSDSAGMRNTMRVGCPLDADSNDERVTRARTTVTVDNVSDPSPDDGGSLGLSDEQIVSKEIDEVVLVRLVFSDGFYRWSHIN